MPARQNWTRDETLKAFALYFILPSGKHDKKNPDIVALANELGRTPSSVVLKLGNIKANDQPSVSPPRTACYSTHSTTGLSTKDSSP